MSDCGCNEICEYNCSKLGSCKSKLMKKELYNERAEDPQVSEVRKTRATGEHSRGTVPTVHNGENTETV